MSRNNPRTIADELSRYAIKATDIGDLKEHCIVPARLLMDAAMHIHGLSYSNRVPFHDEEKHENVTKLKMV